MPSSPSRSAGWTAHAWPKVVLSAPITRLLTAGPDNVLGIHAAASAVNRAAAADIAGWILGGGESRPFYAMSTTNALGVKHVDYRADDVDGLRKTEAPESATDSRGTGSVRPLAIS